MASNWTMGDVLRVQHERQESLDDFPISPKNLAALIDAILDGTISGKIAKDVFEEMVPTHEPPDEIIKRLGLVQVSDPALLEKVIDEILEKQSGQVEAYKSGKTQLFGFFVGETMKAMKGKANPKIVNELLKKKLE